MNIDTLYVRTEKGQNALTDRYVKLPHSLMRALIIVDGQRNVGELHTMAPLYDDLDESLETLFTEGFIEITQPQRERPKAMAENADGTPHEAPKQNTDAPSHKNVKWRLISMLQVELGSKSDASIKAAAEKMIHSISSLPEEYLALSAAWKKCVKVTKITIDVELAETIRRQGEELLAQLQE
ncbi:hypothetical protein [Sulfuriflexus mobilis]|uniref:hypothetical protein n=1 Tax=Sulfuriflexus mobilis TaxID=1811807 RepID=UPI000F82F4B7|nr:hypothetical protein [Sulfuriflexus mobilis]